MWVEQRRKGIQVYQFEVVVSWQGIPRGEFNLTQKPKHSLTSVTARCAGSHVHKEPTYLPQPSTPTTHLKMSTTTSTGTKLSGLDRGYPEGGAYGRNYEIFKKVPEGEPRKRSACHLEPGKKTVTGEPRKSSGYYEPAKAVVCGEPQKFSSDVEWYEADAPDGKFEWNWC